MFVIFAIIIVFVRHYKLSVKMLTNTSSTQPTNLKATDETIISVLTPTYERQKFIPYLARMIAAQTTSLHQLEWVVVDDSKISAYDWFAQCPLQHKLHRLTYVHLPHKVPIGCKRNIVKTLATGSYNVHMDDDDYYAPNYIETVMGMFQSTIQPSLIGATSMPASSRPSRHVHRRNTRRRVDS